MFSPTPTGRSTSAATTSSSSGTGRSPPRPPPSFRPMAQPSRLRRQRETRTERWSPRPPCTGSSESSLVRADPAEAAVEERKRVELHLSQLRLDSIAIHFALDDEAILRRAIESKGGRPVP